ncbi:Putative acyl-CoA dehydrogenase FadE17 [Pandoraea terrae]|uniref:Acyl-CoA dehydrogenase FadE17 n=1 Tax=Pandoraea terrae TaxID=1537710 RepID=A0A5E4YUS8_9BURK|nr:acyl-CoA dehydrogenase family protein [Pandoraea terrae]VVE52486.1 Putative acyl-CoA dehydrogenase FadE17 [Pandoraea terrae]
MTELEQFRAETRDWLDANCPLSMRAPLTPDDMVWAGMNIVFGSEDQMLWFERMRARGWFAPGWPVEYGGGGLSPRQARIVEEEMARLKCRQPQFNLGMWMLGPVLLEYGTDAQKAEFLRPIAEGRVRWCQGFSEPNAGSDLASLKTSARREGDMFVVNGSKIWTSYGDKADYMYALVRTDANARKQDGISFVLIDMHLPGVTVKPIELISGKSSFCEVFFDDVRVPVGNLIGQENAGWTVAKSLLQHERAAMSKFSEGQAPSHDALAVAKAYLADAEPVWRDRLAAVLMDAQAFALTHQRVKEAALAREDVSGPASIMKLVHSEQEAAKYELLMQLMGHRGLSWEGEMFTQDEHDICRQWMLSKTFTIAGGSSEVQLNIIAKRVLGLPA